MDENKNIKVVLDSLVPFMRLWEEHFGLEKNIIYVGKYKIEITEVPIDIDVANYFKERNNEHS